jgi:hypothetical protein
VARLPAHSGPVTHAAPSYVQLSGYGASLRPRAPYAIHRVAGEALEVSVEIDGFEQSARVDPAPVRAPQREPFGELVPSPRAGPWQIEVGGVYVAPWPQGAAVVSAPDPSEPPFFLLRVARGALVYVQGPFPLDAAPSEAQLAGKGQREVARGARGEARWIELAYEHGGERWRQRHYLRPLTAGTRITISTQAQVDLAERVHAVADEVVDQLAPYRAG